MTIFIIFLFFIFFNISNSIAQNPLIIISTAETHSMLESCECDLTFAGGFAKRGTIINEKRKKNQVLLLDAGGFSGGGIYDPYTEGRKKDSIRTLLALRTMGYMKYDAVCVGDDELLYGADWLKENAFKYGVKLVSANLFLKEDIPFVNRYIIVKKNNISIGITGVTTQERIYSLNDSLIIKDPLASLKEIWNELKEKSDFIVILSHCGEEISRQILEFLPECNVVVNGHKKISTENIVINEKKILLQFEFLGKSLSYAEFDSKQKIKRNGWLNVTKEILEEPNIAEIIKSHNEENIYAKPIYDLYIMSLCPYGKEALKEFISFKNVLKETEWNIWFIGSIQGEEKLSSLHGQEEIEDEMIWLAVKEIYPQKWEEFLIKRIGLKEVNADDVFAILRDMNLDIPKIKSWIEKNGKKELKIHYLRSMKMGINASPTLLINNMIFNKEIIKYYLLKDICEKRKTKISSFCDSLPECIKDTDCKKKGKIGKCVNIKKDGSGECQYTDSYLCTLFVFIPDTSFTSPDIQLANNISNDFSGVIVKLEKISSANGRKIIGKFDPLYLPFYVIETSIEKDPNFSIIEEMLVKDKGFFIFKKNVIKPFYFYKKSLIENSITLFVDPVFPAAKEAIDMVLSYKNKNIKIMPVFYDNISDTAFSELHKLQKEEALRWITFLEKYPKKYYGYLELFSKRDNVSYWFKDLKKLKINIDIFISELNNISQKSKKYYDEINELGINGPIEVFLNNREVVVIKNKKELREILEYFIKNK